MEIGTRQMKGTARKMTKKPSKPIRAARTRPVRNPVTTPITAPMDHPISHRALET
jgi:hypothetical protein